MTLDRQSLPTSQSSGRKSSGRWRARWARHLLRGKLANLEGGKLVVHDQWGRWEVGRGAPEFEVQVHDTGFYVDAVLGGSLGVGGAYIDALWSCAELPGLLRLFIRNESLTDSLDGGLATLASGVDWLRHRLRSNTRSGSQRNIEAHYDLGNDFFALFLDPTMTYSAGIFESPDATMGQASLAKLDRICRKLDLQPGHRVLEIGTGWGSFAMHAASQYGCHVTTTTISREQYTLAAERIRQAGLEDRIDVLLEDYRDLQGGFDRLVSIEMIEAVGHEFLPDYFETCAARLKHDGAMLLQGITMPDNRYPQYLKCSDFIRKYVFPGSCCPAISAMRDAISQRTDFKIVHLEDIGLHYAVTLRRWRERFLQYRGQVVALGYPERLTRLWDYYLAYSEAGFAERYIGDVQLLLHKPGCGLSPPLGALPLPDCR